MGFIWTIDIAFDPMFWLEVYVGLGESMKIYWNLDPREGKEAKINVGQFI